MEYIIGILLLISFVGFRWYGGSDPVTLDKIRQIPGMRSIVSAVYDVKPGEVWPEESIKHLVDECREHGLIFDVVESIPVAEECGVVMALHPDVVLTDIKMPYMDGLELARRVRADYPNIYIMLCTGFDEFEYAKEAVHLEIKEYMLKPINAVELSECLTRLKDTLDKEREEKLNVKKLEDYFQEALPALKSNFLISLIEGRVSEEDYKRFLTAYQIDMKGPLFCCVVFHTSANHVPEGMDSLLLSMSVDREIKQRLTEKWKCQEFIYLGNTVLVLEVDTEENLVQITDECDRFCRWAYRIMGAVVTAGVGTTCESLYDISTSYEGAREAVSYRVLYGTKRAINIGEIVPKESKIQTQQEEARMHELFRAIHVGDEEEIEKAARKEIEKLHKNAKTIGQYNLATMEIVSGYFKFCSNNSLDFNEMSGNVPNLYQKVSQMDESALTSWIIGMSLKISEQLKNARNSTSRRLVTEAQNIVRERYMESEITLDDVCSALGVSNSYFSSIFKKEMGKSFISYLTDYRMDIAAEMILNTTEKSYTIAEKVGYLDANYFSYVFKKRFGMSPSKYRNEHLKK